MSDALHISVQQVPQHRLTPLSLVALQCAGDVLVEPFTLLVIDDAEVVGEEFQVGIKKMRLH